MTELEPESACCSWSSPAAATRPGRTPSDDHAPGNYTILNFQVDDIDKAVDELTERGVEFERYEGFDQDEKGIARGEGPRSPGSRIPAGNILSVIQDS